MATKLDGSNSIAITQASGVYTISEVKYPILNTANGHNLWVLKDPNGRVVAELDGLATSADGTIKAIGYYSSDKLYVYEFSSAYLYDSSYTQSVMASGSYSQVMSLWNSATQCGGLINAKNLSYPFMGLGSNSNSVATTLGLCMGTGDAASVTDYSLYQTPGVGTSLLDGNTIVNVQRSNGINLRKTAYNDDYISDPSGFGFYEFDGASGNNLEFASFTKFSSSGFDGTSGYAWGSTDGVTAQFAVSPQQSAPPSQPSQTSIAFTQMASLFGSTLGRMIGGSNLVIGTAAGSVISTIALSVGATLFPGLYRSQASAIGSASEGTGSVWSDFGNNLAQFGVNATIGSATSYLAAEFAQSIGLNGIAGQIFDAVSGDILQYVATKALASTTIGAELHIHAASSLGKALESGIAGFIGAELASLIVTPHTVAEATLSSLGSAVGTLVATSVGHSLGLIAAGASAGPIGIAIGAFVGFILGDLIGSLFGHHKPRIPTASAETVLQIPYARYALGTETSANGGDLQLADAMAKAARDTLNGLIAQITGGKTPFFVSNTYSPTQAYGLTGSQIYVKLGGVQTNVSTANQAVDKGVLWALPQTKIIGGDLILKRAVQNGVWSTVTEMLGDLQIASDYETYLKAKPVIDAAIGSSWNNLSSTDQAFYTANKAFMTRAISASQLPLAGNDVTFYNANKTQVDRIVNSISVSSFAAGWIVTLARATELKLDQFGASDFFGGLQGFLQSFNVNSTGTAAHFEDVSLHQNGNNLAISLTGNAAPGTFSLLPTAINGPSDQDLFNPRFQQGATGSWNGTWGGASTNGATSIPGWTISNNYSNPSAFDWGDNLNSDWSGSGNDVLWIHGQGTPVAGTVVDAWSDPIASVAGVNYEASVYAAQHRGSAQMYMVFMDAAGNWLGVSGSSGTARESGAWHGDLANFNQLVATGVAPTGTAYRRILLRNAATGGTDPYAFFTRPETHGSLAAYAGTWDAGGQSVQIANFAASIGYNVTSPTGISAGNDLIIAPNNGQAITVSAGMDAISVPDYGIYIPATNTGDDIIIGSTAGDNISAGVGNDWIDGGAGSDTIVGGAGRDVLIGGAGDDNIQAGSGSTYLSGGDGNDVLRGGAGNDTIVGGAGSDTMTGGAGNDTFIIDQDGGGVYDSIDGGDGSDTASFERFTSGVSIDMSNQSFLAGIVTLAVNSQLTGGQSITSTDGRYTFVYQTDGNLVLYGPNGYIWASNTSGTSVGRAVMQGDGNLVVYDAGNVARWSSGTYGNAGANLQLDNTGLLRVVRTNGTAAWQVGGGGSLQLVNNGLIYGDSWKSIENLTGSNYNDTLTGSNYGSTLRGLDGNDVLNGGSGNDILEGGTGADVLNGGGGNNTASYVNSSVGVYVNLATGTAIGGDATGDTFSNIQNLTGSANADELAGDGGVNIIDAGLGDDWIDATAGADTYTGGDGFDTVDYSATNFAAGSGTVTVVIPGYGTYSYVGTIPAISVNLSANSVTVRNPDGSTATQTVNSIEQFIGTNGNDSFSSAGTSLNVTWDGGAGTDTASGGSGSDTYIYGMGYGNLTISDSNSASNTIKFKSGVTFDDLWANYSSGSLQIGIRGQANFATVTSNFVSGNNVIKTLDLAGVAQVDLTQIQGVNVLSDGNDTFNGTAGFSRFILANNGDDTINPFTNAYSTTSSIIDGGLGNDTIVTSAGDDQFLFERGDGHDTITDGGGQNTIIFGPTVNSGDVLYQVVGNDLYVGLKDLNNANLTASQVSDNIKIVGGGVQYVGMIYGGTYMATNFSVEAGGATTDLTKANIAWTQTPYYDGGYYYPVVLDLNNDGLEITPVAQSDIVTKDAAGNVLRTSWVGPTNGILAFDRNGDGKINNTADISFVQDKAGAKTDLEGLAGWDTNGDGVLDAKDTNFGKLVVWVDANQDGRAQSKEVKTLTELGIAAINLTPTPTGFDGKDTIDTVVRNTTTFTRADGTNGTGYDVGFARQLLSGPAATSDAKSIDPNAVGTFGQLKNDPLSLAQAKGLTGDKLTSKALGSLANVDTSDAGGSMSAANAARWADIIDPTKNQARKALMAQGGDDGANLDAIRSTRARPDGSTVLTGRGIRDAATRLQAIVVDFNRNGADLIDAAKSNALVDATNSGNAAQIGWVKSSDGILALDRNGDGLVDPATEMSFVGDVPNTRTGLQGLAAYDDNGDGILSAADSSFAKFLIWRDANGNGVSDVGEVQTLAQAGVKDLRLNVSQVRPDRGVGSSNDVLGVSQIDFTDGSSRALYDVALGFADSKDQTSTQQTTTTGNAASLLQTAAATTQAATGGSSSSANSESSASQGISGLTSVGRARGSLDGPGGVVVQSAATAQDDAQWWRNASIVGQNLADLAAPLAGEGATLATNGSSIASASSADAATLQRLMLLRQNMAGQGGSVGGDAAVWARGTANDAAMALAANTSSTLTTIPKASLAA